MGGNDYSFLPFFKSMTGLILGAIGGLGLGILIFVPALLKKRKIDTAKLKELQQEEEKQLNALRCLSNKIMEDEKYKAAVENEISTLETYMRISNDRLNELSEEERIKRDTLASLADTEQKVKANMEKAIEEKSEALSKEYQQAEEEYRKEYMNTTKEMADEFQKTMVGKRAELNLIEDAITDKQAIYEAILQMEQRKAKEEAERDFYRLNIPEEDLEEIEKIREITPYLRNPEVLNKVLWTTYYQKPYQDLIARQFSSSKPTGIYKITCLPDDKIYIGQSVNVPNRFSEHIKRGLGAEPATRNRLYPAMKKWGVENFIFELLEEVPREKLDERERYWIEYFHSAEVGLNGNKGVKG